MTRTIQRSPMPRRRTPLGQAKHRRDNGGKRATGRPSVSRVDWNTIVVKVWERARGQCEVLIFDECPIPWRCGLLACDPHHVIKRSRGGPDSLDNVVALCRSHHDQTDAPFVKGRLVIRALGNEQFTFEIVMKPSKWLP